MSVTHKTPNGSTIIPLIAPLELLMDIGSRLQYGTQAAVSTAHNGDQALALVMTSAVMKALEMPTKQPDGVN